MGLLETVAERANEVLIRWLFGDGKFDGTFCRNAGLILLQLFFLLPPCLCGYINES